MGFPGWIKAPIVLSLVLLVISSTNGQIRCTERVNWPFLSCPDGDFWACWADPNIRDKECSRNIWGNGVPPRSSYIVASHPGVLGLGSVSCYCCGLCPYPRLPHFETANPFAFADASLLDICKG